MDKDKEVIEMCRKVECGELTTVIDGGRTWSEIYAGNVCFNLSNGWKVVVFNDCDEWDYVDSYIEPDGTVHEYESLSLELQDYTPDNFQPWGLGSFGYERLQK